MATIWWQDHLSCFYTSEMNTGKNPWTLKMIWPLEREGRGGVPYSSLSRLQSSYKFTGNLKSKNTLKKTYLGNVRSWTCKKCVPSSRIHVKDNTFHSQHVTIQVQLHFQSKSVLKHQSSTSSVFHAGSPAPTRCPNSLCASTPRLLKRWI